MLTGDPTENERNKCLNILNANAFLTKPVSMYEITREFRKVMQREEHKDNEEESKTISKKLILVVEDDKLLSNLIKMFLEDYEIIQSYSNADVIHIYIYIYNCLGSREI